MGISRNTETLVSLSANVQKWKLAKCPFGQYAIKVKSVLGKTLGIVKSNSSHGLLKNGPYIKHKVSLDGISIQCQDFIQNMIKLGQRNTEGLKGDS